MNKSKMPLKSTHIQRGPATTPSVTPRPAAPQTVARRPQPAGPAAPVQRTTCACGGELGADGECAACRERRMSGQPPMVAGVAPIQRQPTDEAVTEATPAQVSRSMLQRGPIKGGGATPGKGEGADLIFIIRAPDDQYTNEVTDYVKTVLKGQSFTEVDNLDDIFDNLARLKARVNVVDVIEPAIKVRRIRIVAHGSTTGDVKMMPRGEKSRRWVSPQEVEAYAQNPMAQSTIAQVMAPGAQIEFWGCNIGAVPQSGAAWAEAFESSFSATSETLKIGFDEFARPADQGESGQSVPGQLGTWVLVTHTDQIDSRSKQLKKSFNQWILGVYQQLAANGDILPIKRPAERLPYMRDLFNRAGGRIRHILIEQKSTKKEVRPGNQKVWLKLWKATPAPKGP